MKLTPKPSKIPSPDFKSAEKLAAEYLRVIASKNFCDDDLSDLKQYIFEAVIDACYDKSVWDYINDRT